MSLAAELRWLDATSVAELVLRGELTAREVVLAAAERIAEGDPALHAIADLDIEAALARADGVSGPAAGVPMLLKDSAAYPNLRFTLGMRAFAARVAADGSPYTDALDNAGALVLGKTTLSELGMLASCESLLFGPTRNPWDLGRSPLGSSGGSAVAVAAGLVPVAHGSDGGGSLRLPAAACGLVALKPSGRRTLPSGPELGVMSDLVVDHVLTRSVRDSELLLRLTESPTSPWSTLARAGPPPKRLRIGCQLEGPAHERVGPSVLEVIGDVASVLEQLGHEIVPLPSLPIASDDARDVYFFHAGAMLDQLMVMLEATHRHPARVLEPYTRSVHAWWLQQRGRLAPTVDAAHDRLIQSWEQQLLDVDVVLSPTTPNVADPIGTLPAAGDFVTHLPTSTAVACFTAIHNLSGAPAISLPLGVSPEGLPVGAMLAAGAGEDRLLLDLAYALEHAMPWSSRHPPEAASR